MTSAKNPTNWAQIIDDELFIEEPAPADSLISHAQLQLELDRVNETHEEWSSFLERANACASMTPSSTQDRTFVGKVPIWKVPVKVC